MKIKKISFDYGVVRIIPHHSVLNSSNRRIQNSLFELFSATTHQPFPWQHKEGWNIVIRDENPNFWWVTKIKNEDEKLAIEYYVVMPREYIESFKIKIRNHAQWKRCTLEDVDEYEFPGGNNVDLFKLKYGRHDMFSLNLEHNEQHTPIRDLMTVSNELRPGERIDFFIRCEPYDRIKWKRVVDYAWEIWDRGSIPYRRGINPSMVFNNLFNLLGVIAHELKDVVDDVIGGFEKAFFNSNGKGKERREFQARKIPERESLMVNGGLSRRTANKRNQAVFSTSIRYILTSDDPLRRDALSKSIESALSELNGDNYLKSMKVNIKTKDKLNGIKEWRIFEPDPNLMSLDETGKLMQLPTRELQEEFSSSLDFNPNVEVDMLPEAFNDPKGVLAGTTEIRGQIHPIYWPTDNKDLTYTPRAFIGSPRVGKDMACVNFIVEANRNHGISAVVPDVIDERNGHRGMSDALRDHLPADRIIDINLGDFDWPIYLGLNSLVSSVGDDRIAGNLITTYLTQFLMGDDIENHQTREYLREFSKAVNGDLIGIKLMCLSKKFREEKIKELKRKGWDTLPLETYHKQEGKQNAISGPILVRLGELLGDEFLKPLFGQPANPDVNLSKWISEGKVIIFRIPSRKLGELAVQTITYWITLLTFLTMISMDGKNNPGTFLVLNEPHQFLTKGMVHFLKRMLLEGPKYRMAPIFLYHNPSVCKELRELNDIMLSSSVNWHIFKNSSMNVYDDLRPYLEPTFTPETAMRATEKFHFIACWLDSMGRYQTPFMVKAPDLVNKRYPTEDNSELTSTHSRLYGKPIADVLNHIQERQRVIYEG